MTHASLASALASVWSLTHLLPGNSQADRVPLYAKALFLLSFFWSPLPPVFLCLFFCGGDISSFVCACSVFQETAADRSLSEREAVNCGHQSSVWMGVVCCNILELSVRSINTLLVFNYKWKRYCLAVMQSFEERLSSLLEVCQVSLYPGNLEGFIVGESLCCPFQLHTSVICEVPMSSAVSSSTRYTHQCSTKWSYYAVGCWNKRQLNK